jgi:hypothetical protein
VPAGANEAYEALRQRVLQPDGRIEHAEGRGVLMRCGLARWAQVQSTSITVVQPEFHLQHNSHQPEIPAALGAELVQLVAGLILSMRQEVMLA